jgi:hypothetical protein
MFINDEPVEEDDTKSDWISEKENEKEEKKE